MPRKRVPVIGPHDLEWVPQQPGFSNLVGNELASGFPLSDGFDALLLLLASDVNRDLAGLGTFDAILGAISDGEGALSDGNLQPVSQSYSDTQAQGQPAVDSLSNTLGTLT